MQRRIDCSAFQRNSIDILLRLFVRRDGSLHDIILYVSFVQLVVSVISVESSYAKSKVQKKSGGS